MSRIEEFLKNKKISINANHILIGVTGSIAAYKVAELIRQFKKNNFEIKIIMTSNACRFITPTTLAVLSENKVSVDMFSENKNNEIKHIDFANWADIMLIAPASANIIGKVAHGLADDLLTSTILAFPGKTLFAPAMNSNMLNNPICQRNIHCLQKMGFIFINTEKGQLACGYYGDGRLAGIEQIYNTVIKSLSITKTLNNKNVLITASATREPIDQVRYISNRSTGKMGFALALVAKERGAKVTLITGPTDLKPIEGIETLYISTAEEMEDKVMYHFANSDIFISAAAVSDFKPSTFLNGKLKKEKYQQYYNLKLVKNRDILKEIGKKKKGQLLVGFAAEVADLEKNAQEKLREKNLDFIVLNDISKKDRGFASNNNEVIIIDKNGNKKKLPLMSKYAIAGKIFDVIQSHFRDEDPV